MSIPSDATESPTSTDEGYSPTDPTATPADEFTSTDTTEPDAFEPVHDEYDEPGNTVKSGEPEPSGPEGGVPGIPAPEIDTPGSRWWKAPSAEEPKPSNSKPSNAELKEPGQGAFRPIKPEEHGSLQMQQGPPGNPNNQRKNSNQLRGGRNWRLND